MCLLSSAVEAGESVQQSLFPGRAPSLRKAQSVHGVRQVSHGQQVCDQVVRSCAVFTQGPELGFHRKFE